MENVFTVHHYTILGLPIFCNMFIETEGLMHRLVKRETEKAAAL